MTYTVTKLISYEPTKAVDIGNSLDFESRVFDLNLTELLMKTVKPYDISQITPKVFINE